ncbi:hypothetical protein HBN50_10395 [Halobacteriovorax sp. GB3]|uniref:hypothetical protein n=1 Tax=Halobacteriovorax sp. GB3 TaxID=2719615 RepID=UPI0023614249|nr:hypothetical protein [Halobacteriovorax sp. GB3]MDD0853511.1 hypothetical protein [Halobacteriovorax sp. GB3]
MRIYKLMIIPFLLFSSNVLAVSDILKCLAKEELIIHKKKSTGPLYRLNQTLINGVSSLGSMPLKKDFYQRICGENITNSPSLNFLQIGLIYGKRMYPTLSEEASSQERFQYSEMQRVMDGLTKTFFNYVSQVQALSPSAKCLKEEIPELDELYLRFRYLSSEISPDWAYKERKSLTRIFNSLNNLENIFKSCKERDNKKNKK